MSDGPFYECCPCCADDDVHEISGRGHDVPCRSCSRGKIVKCTTAEGTSTTTRSADSSTRFAEADSVTALLHQVVGAASVGLWDGKPATGVFIEREARNIAEEAEVRLRQLISDL